MTKTNTPAHHNLEQHARELVDQGCGLEAVRARAPGRQPLAMARRPVLLVLHFASREPHKAKEMHFLQNETIFLTTLYSPSDSF